MFTMFDLVLRVRTVILYVECEVIGLMFQHLCVRRYVRLEVEYVRVRLLGDGAQLRLLQVVAVS